MRAARSRMIILMLKRGMQLGLSKKDVTKTIIVLFVTRCTIFLKLKKIKNESIYLLFIYHLDLNLNPVCQTKQADKFTLRQANFRKSCKASRSRAELRRNG